MNVKVIALILFVLVITVPRFVFLDYSNLNSVVGHVVVTIIVVFAALVGYWHYSRK